MPSNSTEYSKEYYNNKKEHIADLMKQTMMCETCNREINKSKKNRHEKTNLHLANLYRQAQPV